jgi:hypothetical protein
MKKSIFIIIAGLILSLGAFSQENLYYNKDLPSYKEYVNKEFGINCSIPIYLKNLDKYYVIWKVRENRTKHSGRMYGPIFLSKDKECIVAFPAQPHLVSTKENEISGRNKGNFPRIQITGELKTALGLYFHYGSSLNIDTVKFDFNDYVTIIAGKKPREMFNADSIFIYDLPNADSVYFFDESLERMRKEKYPYCTGMFITKNDRATMDIKLFFTKKGEQKKNQYIEMLKKSIWYDDKFHKD